MKYTLLLATVAISVQCYAQTDSKREFGVISPEEIEMKSYSRDTSASAVILFDLGSIELNDDFSGTFRRHIRIKFFGSGDIDKFASKIIYFSSDNSKVSKIKGTTYNMTNGKLVSSELSPEGIFKGKVNKVINSVRFTLPNVKPGSIIEYSYVLTINSGLIPPWQFQQTIPTIYSEYRTSIPKAFTFRKDMQGFLALSDMESSNDGANEKLIMKDAPAFKVEPFITTADDYLSGVNYFITAVYVAARAGQVASGYNAYNSGKFLNFDPTWKRIAKAHNESPDFGQTISQTRWLNGTVDPLLAGATTPEEKTKKIHDYVKQNIEWNGIVDKIPDRSLKKVLEEKNGSSSEINMLMIAMMRRANLDAYPLLVSTRDHGMIRQFSPAWNQFNDVICVVKINNHHQIIDGSDKTLPQTALPARYLNGDGLLITSSDTFEWLPVVAGKSRIVYNADLKLNSDGQMEGKLVITRDGLDGGQMRSDITKKGKDEYLKETFQGKDWEFKSSNFVNMDAINEAPKEEHELVIKDHAQLNGDVIYINPYLIGMEENEFKSEVRQYPVSIPTPFDHTYSAKIEIPDGYKVEELPASKMSVLPDGGGRFIYSTTMSGKSITFTSQLSIAKNVILPEQYRNLREFYSSVIAKQAEQIVLKKH